ncbi:hypothetical protein XccvBFoX7_gp92c [Xanthomonas phage FoX7]|uniref:Uncharacterized protein n=2 Tax=Carpasinavirus XcP1 TaxID=2182344 RepID=A0A858NPE0_9CAUD|nr:hypothetical protein XccvBFoX6_gp92c [Xanthomonas phage FoX6]QJB22249.1 hypothetical protein XccvBFoX7_gp92c [Xanthomonas phage FoX7]
MPAGTISALRNLNILFLTERVDIKSIRNWDVSKSSKVDYLIDPEPNGDCSPVDDEEAKADFLASISLAIDFEV